MPSISLGNQAAWAANPYILLTTRVLVVIGISYLIQTLVQLTRTFWLSSSRPPSRGTRLGAIDLDFNPDDNIDVVSGVEIEMSMHEPQDVRRPPPIHTRWDRRRSI